MLSELLYQIALTLLPQIGTVKNRLLLERMGSAENVFKATKGDILSIEGLGERDYLSIKKFDNFKIAEEEIEFIEKNAIQPIFLLDKHYPKRLFNCYDAPIMLYSKGIADLNNDKVVSIVGTRHNTPYGKEVTEKIVSDLKSYNVLVVSGLAYGIDIVSHKSALANGLCTVGVIGSGLDWIYPQDHTKYAEEIAANGGAILTEYLHNTPPDRYNFPHRNRIVAGMSDALIVIETLNRGGSMITAELGNSYNRDVFAVPGKLSDKKSQGCNTLIQQNKAALFSNVEDLALTMGWEKKPKKKKNIALQLFMHLTADEKIVVDIIKEKETVHIDDLQMLANMKPSVLATVLLQLELNNIIASLPGKMYALI